MTKIKIISDPYESQISYEQFDESSGRWLPVDNENSRLHSQKLTKAVFPFVVKDIVDVILDEFQISDEKISITFEGASDEYKELNLVCSDPRYSGAITVSTSDRYLRNARDILPAVKEIFDQMQPLIAESVKDNKKIEREKQQFADVSKEAIPICILGNYSAGKSTFINALIGYEILPSGDDPVTAKIHRIERSDYSDRASVRFDYDGQRVEIIFGEPGISPISAGIDDELFQQLQEYIDRSAAEPILRRVGGVLEIINDSANAAFTDHISDMIEIRVPFNREGLFGNSQNKFVIFDTPGSNTASNHKHFEVLRKAMEDLSNGLPIYLSEYDKLDTKDNESLCRLIKDMKELDSRFTMIVVNKADKANLGKNQLDEEAILNQTIPKNLYAGGLYFVSSIMGLGSKNDGHFVNDFYEETFSDHERKFSDSESKYYKRLYLYDIMPAQIKQKSIEESGRASNRIFANSGLYWIEAEIEKFAGIYSPYNKCHQSILFLKKVIAITAAEIESTKSICEESKQHFEDELEQGKAQLIAELVQKSNDLQEEFYGVYPVEMRSSKESVSVRISKDDLVSLEKQITEAKRSETDYDALNSDLSDAQKATAGTFKKLFGVKKLDGLTDNFKEIIETVKDSQEKRAKLSEEQKKLDQLAAEELLSIVRTDFDEKIIQAGLALNEASASYCTDRSRKMKDELAEVVTGSSALTTEKREELTELIMKYAPVFSDKRAEDIFVEGRFRQIRIALGNKVLFETNRLNLGGLATEYNAEFKKGLDSIVAGIAKSHETEFKLWADCLLQKIRENITEYNAALNKLVRLIAEDERRICDLEERQRKLTQYTHDIEDKMAWKTQNKAEAE